MQFHGSTDLSIIDPYEHEERYKRKIMRCQLNILSDHIRISEEKGGDVDVKGALISFYKGKMRDCLIDIKENRDMFWDLIEFLRSDQFYSPEGNGQVETSQLDVVDGLDKYDLTPEYTDIHVHSPVKATVSVKTDATVKINPQRSSARNCKKRTFYE